MLISFTVAIFGFIRTTVRMWKALRSVGFSDPQSWYLFVKAFNLVGTETTAHPAQRQYVGLLKTGEVLHCRQVFVPVRENATMHHMIISLQTASF